MLFPSPLEALKASLAPNPEAWTSEGVGTCAICSGPAETFRDALSVKEYTLSRMCQTCQDDIFEPQEPQEETPTR